MREGRLIALAAMAIGLVALLLGWNGWTTYEATRVGVHNRANELAQATERHALQILTEARGLMEVVDVVLGNRDVLGLETDRDLWASLRALTAAAETLDGLIVVDRTGRIVLWNRAFPVPEMNVGQDPDFADALASDGMVAGELRIGALSKRPVFILGRRLRGGQGAIFISVDAERVARTFEASGLAGTNRLGLYRADGAVLFTYPWTGEIPPDKSAADDILQPDGDFAALRAVPGAPIYAMAAVDPTSALRAWRNGFLSRLLIGAVGATLIIAFTRLAIRQIRREREARAALGALNRGLEAAVAERTRRLSEVAEEQRRAKALAEAATQAKSRFLTAVGHDLRQPLQALRLYQRSLALKGGDPASQRLLTRMGEAITAAEGLLNSIMEIGRIEAGQIVIQPAELPFADLADALEAQTGDRRVRVVPSAVVLLADRVILGRILGNLVANAIKHGRGGRVLVGCRRVAAGGVRLMVCDQGGGIPADKLDAIFEEFYQLDNASRSRDKGFGLGLSIARRLAAASGFGISVASSPGGSAFSVHLPPQAVRSWPVPAARRPQAT